MLRGLLSVCLVVWAGCDESDRFEVDRLEVGTLYEGESPVVVVAHGTRFVASAVIDIRSPDPRLVASRDQLEGQPTATVSADGRLLAFVIDVPMLTALPAGETAELEVSITQEDKDGELETEQGTLTIVGLDELSVLADLSPAELATDDLQDRYSYIHLRGPLRLVGSEPVVLRSTGELRTGDITILDASGGSAATGGPGLCAELGYASSIANGTEPGPGGCGGGEPTAPAECSSTGEPVGPPAAMVPIGAFGGGGGAGGLGSQGGTGGGGGGVIRLEAARLRVPGLFQVTVDGASGCPATVDEDSGSAGDGGAIWLRVREDIEIDQDLGFSALPGFADRELFAEPGRAGGYRVDLPRPLSASEGQRFFAGDRGLGEHPFASAPDQGAAFAAPLFQGPMLVTASGVIAEPAVEVVGGTGAGIDLVVDGQVMATVDGGGPQVVDLDLEPGLHQVCAGVEGSWATIGADGADCRWLAYLRR
jgi:hypothetical protein